ncbi:uncharacterized protein AB675_6500 [Cyphellophora attinorum]|uniref:Uncharacterized protein n=1 Tax=Cyphellophora attinorum TaxID=1664694 RepID=A0A0N0NQD1_9EURO|nr:uncharacterized protein AB675_6500 [Phialophora attinorum]KPI43768.1 hypothetical protein AB675_6500 [Phialophora attinorum]
MAGRDRGRRARDSSSESSSDEETFTHIQCWVPASDIDLVVLATYLKEFIDDTATIKPAPNPQNTSKQGFLIGARNTLSVAGCRDIIEDSRNWEKEKATRSYRRDPYSFNDSDTWHSRRKNGATPGHTNPRSKRKQPATDAPDSTSRSSATTQNQQRSTTNRHGRDPSPEPPPRPGHPPPDMLSTRIPKPDINKDMRKLSVQDQDTGREQQRKATSMTTTTDTTANRGARIQPSTSTTTTSSRHRDKVEDDTKAGVGFSVAASRRIDKTDKIGKIGMTDMHVDQNICDVEPNLENMTKSVQYVQAY